MCAKNQLALFRMKGYSGFDNIITQIIFQTLKGQKMTTDSMSSVALTFPGQGSQYIGMGKDLAEHRSEAALVFEEVDDAIGMSLSKIIFAGDEQELKLTENTQPALMAVSMAVIKVLEQEGFVIKDDVRLMAGHSLGEYSALCAAGVFSIADTAKLLRLRGKAMQKAVAVGEGAMAAILGLEIADVEALVGEVASNSDIVSVANDNAFGQVVISGQTAAVEKAAELAKAKGAKRALILPVSAPFHCSLMQPAADEMAEALKNTNLKAPIVPIMANVTAALTNDPEEIRRLLVEQVTGVVRWRESVLNMGAMGISSLVEVGAGKVLSGLARRIDKEIATQSIESLASIDEFMTANN